MGCFLVCLSNFLFPFYILQSQITIEQERVISAREATIASLESELNSKTKSLENTESELAKTQTSLKECQKKLEMIEKSMESKENMISWLNKQLNELQGLSNLSKFRQNLVASRSINPTNNNGTGDANNTESFRLNGTQDSTPGFGGNSWAPPLQSTSTPLGQLNNNTSGQNDSSTNNGENLSNSNNSRTNASSRVPSWAKSRGKVTLANSSGPASANGNNSALGKQSTWRNY